MATVSRYPTSDITVGWQVSAGARWDAVDDPAGAPDDDAVYVFTTASGQRQAFGMGLGAVPGGSTINSVTVVARIKAISASDYRINIRNEAAAIDEDTDHSASDSYADYSRVWTVNPWTAAPWSVNEANGESATANRLEGIEVRSIAPATDIRCTQLYAVIDYTPAGGSPARPCVTHLSARRRAV